MSSPSHQSYLNVIKNVVREAWKTDYIMPIWLPFLGFLLIIVAVTPVELMLLTKGSSLSAFATLSTASAIVLVAVIGGIIDIYVIYKWIARRNDHFTRVHRLYSSLIDYLTSLGIEDAEIAQMKSISDEAKFSEDRKGAALWVILYLITQAIPLVGFIVWAYIMHFLTRDFFMHERREYTFFRNLTDILKKRDVNINLPEAEMPNRNTILYIILTIITLGLFGLYWIYVVTKDPNEHFKKHRVFEKALIDALEGMQ